MNDNVMDSMDPGFLEVARRLEAYADLRLTASVAATTRMRMNVMSAAHRRAALIEADATQVPSSLLPPTLANEHARRTRTAWRRPAAALLAATLTLGIVAGTVSAAAKAGGPLYAARLWVETATLPAAPAARAVAEMGRIEERLLEVQQASADGDASAAQAALAAYSAIVDEAELASAGDPVASAELDALVARHIAVLTALIDTLPAAARDAVAHALASSTKALRDDVAPGGNGGGNGGHVGQPGVPANGAQPTANPQPVHNAQPDNPAATPVPKPAATDHPARPAKSPAPSATPAPSTKPGNGGGSGLHNGPANAK
jgi:hypothetical protein